MAVSVVGRDAELRALSDFLAGIPEGASVLVLEGEAGMGKTTLWRACLERAAEAGLRILEAQPAESETELSFAGLGDLLGGVLDEVGGSLPSAQQRALSRALVLEDDADPPAEPRAIGVAVQSTLRVLAASGPTLVAVDDVQWLDQASAGALAFACRRLSAERIGVLIARRSGIPSGFVDDLRRSLATDRVETVGVGPLDVTVLHRLLQDRLGVTLPRPLLAEVCQASGGNPFFAIEIVRTMQRRGSAVEAGQPLPVPDSLHELLDERLRALPSDSRDFLLAAAAHAHPTIAITEAATEVDAGTALGPALEAGIVELDGTRIRFTHPLLAACAYEAADPRRRNAIHGRLSEILEDLEARAWQLAAATAEPDDGVASVLEDAAHHARARGAPRPAALLLDRSAELTTRARGDDRIRREIDAAYLHFESGDAHRADAQLRTLIAPLGPGPQRARALVVLARVRLYEVPEEARTIFLQVIEEAADDPRTRAIAHEGVASCCVWMFDRWEDVLRHTTTALTLAAEIGDEAMAADAILARLGAETLLGRDTAAATTERALALQRSAEELRVMDQPLISLAECWCWTDAFEDSQRALGELMRHALEHGDENGRPWLLFLLGDLERLLGRLRDARILSREGQDAADQSGQPVLGWHNLALESLVLAQLGQVDLARKAAEAALERPPNHARLIASQALGHIGLSVGSPRETVTHLEPCIAFVQQEGIVEPGAIRFVPDHVEALSEIGRREEAIELVGWYEVNALRLGRTTALANCARCRGLIAAQDGDLDEALAAFGEALALHARIEVPLDHARTLLAFGVTQRRLKRRREARATLEGALGIFEDIGAALWAERARAELKRISGRASTPGALTPAEERVAALVCEGKTNREVAAALFLSDRTVEGHLARIFGKLGIRHRAELPGALQTRGIDLSNTGDSPVSAGPAAP